jgi:site-specific DNA-adenine methylase
MWSYYGSKSKVVGLYPAPKYDVIIEPFAGSARYALEYWDKQVYLVEKDKALVALWKWLQKCSPKDILGLPKMKSGENVDAYTFDCPEAKWLMGFMINQGSAVPKKTVSSVGSFGKCEREKKRIAESLFKIKHWNIIEGSYETDTPILEATFFVDPPYIEKGIYYRQSSKKIDFDSLATWCKNLKGQVMVCENAGATWLDFKPLATMRGSIRTSKEVVWYNEETT